MNTWQSIFSGLALAASLAAPGLVMAQAPVSGVYSESFNGNGHRGGLSMYGSAQIDSESLLLTPNQPSQAGLAVIGAGKLAAFDATFNYYFARPGSTSVADGMSFNLGVIPDGIVPGQQWELGPGNGLTVCFDLYDFTGLGFPSIQGMRVIMNGQTIASAQGAITSADRGQWRPMHIMLSTSGLLSVTYNGNPVFTNVATGYVADSGHRFSFAARTGAESAEQRIDDIIITTTPLSADSWRDALPIRGDGFTWFDTTSATTDGLPACPSNTTSAAFANDVWYCWTAQYTGSVNISTVGYVNWLSKLAIYDGCGAGPEGLGLLACGAHTQFDFHGADINLRVQAGHSYLLRLGDEGDPNQPYGQGIVAISTHPDCPADFNHSGAATVQDIFDFLSVWFSGCP